MVENKPRQKARRARFAPRAIAPVSALLLSCVLAACGSSSGTGAGHGTVPVSATTPAATGPVGTVVWDIPAGEPISLDPLKSYNYAENTVLPNMCESLLSIAPNFSVQPWLASSYKRISPTVWQYNIRHGVKFWDGAPMTAADVVYSLRRQIDPANASFYLTPFGQEISAVTEVNRYTVRVTTKQPSVIINEMMATALSAVGQASYIKAKGKSYGTPAGGLMCTGPFEFSKWIPGQSVTMVRNPHYWNTAHAALAQKFVFRFITDQTLLSEALLSGEIEGTYEAPASALPELENTSAGHIYLGPTTDNVSLLVTLRGIRGPLRDLATREALSMAINRAGLAKTVYDGAASPLKSSLLLPIHYPFASSLFAKAYAALPAVTQNLPAARRLAKASNSSTSAPIVLAILAGDPRSTETANEIVAAGSEIGLRIQVKEVQATTFENLYFEPQARNAYDMMLGDNWEDFADPLEFLSYAAIPNVQNFTNYNNPVVTRLYYAAQDPASDQRRAELTTRAVTIFARSLQIIPLLYTPERLFLGSKVTGAPATFPYLYYPWAAHVGASR